MFRQITEYERMDRVHRFMSSAESFKYKKDLGDIYEMESNSVHLKYFDMVKVRRTGKIYAGKEILLLNVTPYCYVNLEGLCKFNMISTLDLILQDVLFGFELGKNIANELAHNHSSILQKYSKYNRSTHTNEDIESEADWKVRSKTMFANMKQMSLGLHNNFNYFFIGNDPQMVKPIDFTGYYFYLARCLNDFAKSDKYWNPGRFKRNLEYFFGSHATSIDKKYQEYIDMANILGVEKRIEDITCDYNTLEEIQSNVKSRIYIFYEVAKYFFKNGRQFKDEDHKNIKKRSYNIRMIYSALGGKICLNDKEKKDPIAYFTAIRANKEDIRMLMDVTNEHALEVLQIRFDNCI